MRTFQMHVLERWSDGDILGGRKLHALISLSVNTVCHDCDLILDSVIKNCCRERSSFWSWFDVLKWTRLKRLEILACSGEADLIGHRKLQEEPHQKYLTTTQTTTTIFCSSNIFRDQLHLISATTFFT